MFSAKTPGIDNMLRVNPPFIITSRISLSPGISFTMNFIQGYAEFHSHPEFHSGLCTFESFGLGVTDAKLKRSNGIHNFSVHHDSLLITHYSFPHSVLKLFTGFASAAFIAWKLTVASAMKSAANAATTNTHH